MFNKAQNRQNRDNTHRQTDEQIDKSRIRRDPLPPLPVTPTHTHTHTHAHPSPELLLEMPFCPCHLPYLLTGLTTAYRPLDQVLVWRDRLFLVRKSGAAAAAGFMKGGRAFLRLCRSTHKLAKSRAVRSPFFFCFYFFALPSAGPQEKSPCFGTPDFTEPLGALLAHTLGTWVG